MSNEGTHQELPRSRFRLRRMLYQHSCNGALECRAPIRLGRKASILDALQGARERYFTLKEQIRVLKSKEPLTS